MENKKIILDPCCGGKMFWFNKENPHVIYGDIREVELQLCDGRKLEVAPDLVMDFRDIPFPDGSFKVVIFDPPHLLDAGESGWLAKRYGSLKKGWEPMIRDGFSECMRVLEDYGVLIFKWNETDIPVSRIIEVIGHEPLVGNKSGKQARTHWMCFIKLPEEI